MNAGVLLGLALLASLGLGLLLYVLVREEAADREEMDREAAERRARRDTGRDE